MSQPMPTITKASSDDVMDIITMHGQSWLDTYPNEAAGVSKEWVQTRVDGWTDPDKLARRIDRIQQAESDPNRLYYVAKDRAGKIVGVCMAFRDEKIQAVGAININKEYYGTGLAQRFMDKIMQWVDPARPLELQVASYNERAKAFYRKYGFEEVEGTEELYGDVIPVVTMIRKGEDDD